MTRIAEQNIKCKLQWHLSLIALVLIGCSNPGFQGEQAAVESHGSIVAKRNTLYLEVSYDGSKYQLIHAHISDSVFAPVPIIKIYGTYGVRVITEDNGVSFEQYTWMKPIDGLIRLPFSDSTAFIELIHRSGDKKTVIGRFSRDDILSAAT